MEKINIKTSKLSQTWQEKVQEIYTIIKNIVQQLKGLSLVMNFTTI